MELRLNNALRPPFKTTHTRLHSVLDSIINDNLYNMEQIKDLVKMAEDFETPNIEALLKAAYIRGYEEGKQVMKAIIADVIKDK